MKRFIAFVLFVALAVVFIPWLHTAGAVEQDTTVNVYDRQKNLVKSVVFKIGVPYYVVNNQTPGVKMDVAPFIQEDRTFVPVRFLGNALGVTDDNINWNGDVQRVFIAFQRTAMMMQIGVKEIHIDGISKPIDVAPILTEARTFLPARYVAEGLGYQVDWDEDTQTVQCWPAGEDRPDVSKAVDWLNEQLVEPDQPVVTPTQPNLPPATTTLTSTDIERLQSYPYARGAKPDKTFEQMWDEPRYRNEAIAVNEDFHPNRIGGFITEDYFLTIPEDHKFGVYRGAELEWFSDPHLVYMTSIGDRFIHGVLRITFSGENYFGLTPGQTYEIDMGFDVDYIQCKSNWTPHWVVREIERLSDFKAVKV